MNDYRVTFDHGEMVEIEAWTSEIAQTIAEEDEHLRSVVSVELLTFQQSEL